jgi:hypothetical protein
MKVKIENEQINYKQRGVFPKRFKITLELRNIQKYAEMWRKEAIQCKSVLTRVIND